MVYIYRDLEGEIAPFLKRKEIIAVVGARQCGKTTLIENMLKGLHGVKSISFDDMKALSLFERDIDSFIDIHVKGKKILFIDEVQYARESGKKLKYIYDREPIKIIISGSSAPDLSIQSGKFLVGRMLTFKLYPFSFREFVRSKDGKLSDVYEQGRYGEDILSTLNTFLEEFICFGGYPSVVLANRAMKETILKNIYSTFLLREIREILHLSENEKLETLMKGLSLQAGNIINYNELCQLTGFSFPDLKKYLRILEETFIAERMGTFHTNKRTELVKAPKIYFIDPGFRNVCIDNFTKERSDKGAIVENFIFTELVKKGKKPKYWRTKSGAEVDFVLDGKAIVPIEVKTNVAEHTFGKSYLNFIEKYSPKKGYIVSWAYESSAKAGTARVYFLPYVKAIAQI